MGGDVVSLDSGCSALTPGAGQVEIICRLSADMSLAHVLLNGMVSLQLELMRSGTPYVESFCRRASLTAALPLALQVFTCARDRGLDGLSRELTLLLHDILRDRRIAGVTGCMLKVRHLGDDEP